MRSPIDACVRVRMLAILVIVILSAGMAAAQRETATPTGTPTDAEIADAIEAVKADPNLATERTIKTLRWKERTTTPPTGMPAWLEWIAGLIRWFEQSARVLVWCAAVVAAGLLGGYIARIVRTRMERSAEETFIAPTHVQALDIRPETLPPQVGDAARLLWDRGDHRAALALLYRGLLSRLAHVHHVPIRDSSTEGDCLALAARHLTSGTREYASGLIAVWQRTVYGHERVQTATVHALCDDFSAALDAGSTEVPA